MNLLDTGFKIATIAGNTYREAIRMKLFLLLAFVALGSLAGGFAFGEFNLGASELRFIADFGFGGMTLFGSLAAVVITVQLLYGEIERRTILPLMAKPIGRGAFLCGKLLGAWFTVVSFIVALALSLMLVLWIRESQLMAVYPDAFEDGRIVSYGNVALFAFLQVMRLVILASVSVFFASYATSSLFAIFMGVFFWIIAQLQGVASEQIASSGGILEWLFRFVALAVPDLRMFDLGGDVIAGDGIGLLLVAKLVGYALLYAILYAGFAAMILRRREL